MAFVDVFADVNAAIVVVDFLICWFLAVAFVDVFADVSAAIVVVDLVICRLLAVASVDAFVDVGAAIVVVDLAICLLLAVVETESIPAKGNTQHVNYRQWMMSVDFRICAQRYKEKDRMKAIYHM